MAYRRRAADGRRASGRALANAFTGCEHARARHGAHKWPRRGSGGTLCESFDEPRALDRARGRPWQGTARRVVYRYSQHHPLPGMGFCGLTASLQPTRPCSERLSPLSQSGAQPQRPGPVACKAAEGSPHQRSHQRVAGPRRLHLSLRSSRTFLAAPAGRGRTRRRPRLLVRPVRGPAPAAPHAPRRLLCLAPNCLASTARPAPRRPRSDSYWSFFSANLVPSWLFTFFPILTFKRWDAARDGIQSRSGLRSRSARGADSRVRLEGRSAGTASQAGFSHPRTHRKSSTATPAQVSTFRGPHPIVAAHCLLCALELSMLILM